jgi:tRNA pseudouridine13 synthase
MTSTYTTPATTGAVASVSVVDNHVAALPYAYGKPEFCAEIKQEPEDFLVTEALGFELSGEGEHAWLYIEKRNLNTADILSQLTKRLGLHERDIGFSGMKDKHAITRQWFSVPFRAIDSFSEARAVQDHNPFVLDGANNDGTNNDGANNDRDDSAGLLFSDEDAGSYIRVLSVCRHLKKLKRGTHKGNGFSIVLRHWRGGREGFDARLAQIAEYGVPNYFGEQRFGIQQRNLSNATAYFKGETQTRKRRTIGIWLSAARSFLFNQLLAKRVSDGSWNRCLSGDVMGLSGSRSVFVAESVDETLLQRLKEGDIHPTGPLWGAGDLMSAAGVAEQEQQVASEFPLYANGLKQEGLKQERRKLRLLVENLDAQWLDEDSLLLSFTLETGTFATMVVRELVQAQFEVNNRGLSE